jgi:hypothetical protein
LLAGAELAFANIWLQGYEARLHDRFYTGGGWGRIDNHQLALSRAGHGDSIIFLHHPPYSSPTYPATFLRVLLTHSYRFPYPKRFQSRRAGKKDESIGRQAKTQAKNG